MRAIAALAAILAATWIGLSASTPLAGTALCGLAILAAGHVLVRDLERRP